jgi:hypothetical protein
VNTNERTVRLLIRESRFSAMWTNLNTSETLALIRPGCRITKDPDDIDATLVVKSISKYYIRIFDEKRGKNILLARQSEAISGNWWIEHGDQEILFS